MPSTVESPSWPQRDPVRSPRTGLTRAHWVASADEQLLAVRPYASGGGIALPGPVSWSGSASDALEGTARTFLLAALRLSTAPNDDPYGHLDFYRRLLVTGAAPGHPGSWPRAGDARQAVVEAASIAVGLHFTRDALWSALTPEERGDLVQWLEEALDVEIPDNNWVLFHAVIAEFLAGCEEPRRTPHEYDTLIDAALRRIDDWYVGDGWFRDGDGENFDYYNAWALHVYPGLLAIMAQQRRPDHSAAVRATARERLRPFLDQHVLFFGGGGEPVFHGRSLIYRHATTAALWMAELLDASPLTPGQTRAVASGVLRYFRGSGPRPQRAYGADGLLPIGWVRPFPQMRQPYSGASSPYWTAKAYLGLLLPPEHAVWTAIEETPPAYASDVVRTLSAPGFALSRTSDDGIVRLVNHGSDHAPALVEGDEPAYSRIAYSTITAPVFTGTDIWDNHATVIDEAGRPGRRASFRRLPRAVGSASAFHPVWEEESDEDLAVLVTTASTLDGPWELRVHRVRQRGHRVSSLRVGGYALAGDPGTEPQVTARGIVDARGAHSALLPLIGFPTSGVRTVRDASPFGNIALIPWCRGDVAGSDALFATLVFLGTAGDGGIVGPVRRDGQRVTVSVDGRVLAADVSDAPTTSFPA